MLREDTIEDFESVFGAENELADQLRREGKLQIRPLLEEEEEEESSNQEQPLAKKQRTGHGGGGGGGKRPASAHQRSPPLPFARI